MSDEHNDYLMMIEDVMMNAIQQLMKACAQNNTDLIHFLEGKVVALTMLRYVFIRDVIDTDPDEISAPKLRIANDRDYEEELYERFASNED